jgi:hypothetical protein
MRFGRYSRRPVESAVLNKEIYLKFSKEFTDKQRRFGNLREANTPPVSAVGTCRKFVFFLNKIFWHFFHI